MAAGKKLTELSKEVKSNLSNDSTLVYVVNNNESKQVDLDNLLFDGIITSNKIAANSITVDKITPETINAIKISAAQINTGDIVAQVISSLEIYGNQIVDNSITADQIADLAINADKIAANAITVTKIADDAITAGKIAANAVNETHIQSLAINADKIAENAVTVAKIADNAIEAGKIAANAVNDTHIQDLAINADKIAENAITVTKIADDAIEAGKIAANAVNETHIAALAVTAGKIAENSITETKIENNSISTGKIQSNAITTNEISAGAVTTNKLLVTGRGAALNSDPGCQDSSAWVKYPSSLSDATFTTITDGLVGNNVIRGSNRTWYNGADRLPFDPNKTYRIRGVVRRSSATANGTCYIGVALFDASGNNVAGNGSQWFYIGGGSFVPGTDFTLHSGEFGFDTTKTFPANARTMTPLIILSYNGTIGYMEAQDLRIEEKIDGELIVDGAITAGKIATGAITAAEIAAGTITGSEIAAGTITGSEIAAGTITTGKIATGAITANEIAASTITANEIAAGAVTSTVILANAITTDKIAAGAIEANEIAANAIEAGKIAAGAVTANEIAAGAVTANTISSGTINSATFTLNTTSGVIQSNNYSNSAGFRIRGNGDAVFNDVTIRGTIKQSKIIVDDSVSLYRSDALAKPAKPTMRVRGYDTSGVVYAPNHPTNSLRGQKAYKSQVKIYGRNATGALIDNRFLCDSSNDLTLDITAHVHYYTDTDGPVPNAPRIAISNNNGSTWTYYNTTTGATSVIFDESMRDIDYENWDPNPNADTHTRMQYAWRKGRIVLPNVASNAILTIAIELIPRSDNQIQIAQYRNLNLDVQVSNWN